MTSGTTWEHAHKWFVKSVKINITLMFDDNLKNKVVYRTALATPGLLIMMKMKLELKRES